MKDIDVVDPICSSPVSLAHFTSVINHELMRERKREKNKSVLVA